MYNEPCDVTWLWQGVLLCRKCCNTTELKHQIICLHSLRKISVHVRLQGKAPTSAVKGIFSHWTPGKRSGSLLMQSFSAAPGGLTRAFSNSREKRWSTRALLNLSENAL